MTPRPLAATLAALLAMALAGCASGSSSASLKQTADGPKVQAPAPGGADFAVAAKGPANVAGTTSGPGVVVGAPLSSYLERSVDASYTVPAGAFLGSFEGVASRAVAMGGYVASSSTQPDSSGRIVSGSVTLKIPAARLADFLNGMPSSFTASAINFGSVDHTAAFIDVNARLGSAHAHLSALNSLLAKATSLADITSLQQQIAQVQTEIDTEQGQLNLLTGSVELATASIQLRERGTAAVPATPPNPVTSGLGGGWSNAAAVTGVVLNAAVTALPLLALGLLGWLAWRRFAPHGGGTRRAPAVD